MRSTSLKIGLVSSIVVLWIVLLTRTVSSEAIVEDVGGMYFDKNVLWEARSLENATSAPTSVPTTSPNTSAPTNRPSHQPTKRPTRAPTKSPTHQPTKSPTHQPTKNPTTSAPTNNPTVNPTRSPITSAPTRNPTRSPTHSPSKTPTKSPSKAPTTSAPSHSPTKTPTRSPITSAPTNSPTNFPTVSPTVSPTTSPSNSPTTSPSNSPTRSPTFAPSISPTNSPSKSPTPPTFSPTSNPTIVLPKGPPTVAIAGSVVGVFALVSFAGLFALYRSKRFPFAAAIKKDDHDDSNDLDENDIEKKIIIDNQNSNANNTTGKPIVASNNKAMSPLFQKAMATPGPLVEPGQIQNVDLLKGKMVSQMESDLKHAQQKHATRIPKQNPLVKATVLEHLSLPVEQTKLNQASQIKDDDLLGILTSKGAKKPLAKLPVVSSSQKSNNRETEISILSEDNSNLNEEDILAALAPSNNFNGNSKKGNRRSPKLEEDAATKKVKGKVETENPGFLREKESSAQPSVKYLEHAEASADAHKSIFHPSGEYMEKVSSIVKNSNGVINIDDEIDATPSSAYLTSVEMRQGHKSIFRPSSLFLTKAKANDELNVSNTHGGTKKKVKKHRRKSRTPGAAAPPSPEEHHNDEE